MRTPILTPAQEQEIAALWQDGNVQQNELADTYGVSPSTVRRILRKQGALPTVHKLNQENAAIIEVVKAQGLDANTLAELFDMPAVPTQVKAFLLQLDTLSYHRFLADVGLLRLQERIAGFSMDVPPKAQQEVA